MAKFVQIVPVKIDDVNDGTYTIEIFALDDTGDVWTGNEYKGWRKADMTKRERTNG